MRGLLEPEFSHGLGRSETFGAFKSNAVCQLKSRLIQLMRHIIISLFQPCSQQSPQILPVIFPESIVTTA